MTDADPNSGTENAASHSRSGYCAWHRGWADDLALAAIIEQGSGPGRRRVRLVALRGH